MTCLHDEVEANEIENEFGDPDDQYYFLDVVVIPFRKRNIDQQNKQSYIHKDQEGGIIENEIKQFPNTDENLKVIPKLELTNTSIIQDSALQSEVNDSTSIDEFDVHHLDLRNIELKIEFKGEPVDKELQTGLEVLEKLKEPDYQREPKPESSRIKTMITRAKRSVKHGFKNKNKKHDSFFPASPKIAMVAPNAWQDPVPKTYQEYKTQIKKWLRLKDGREAKPVNERTIKCVCKKYIRITGKYNWRYMIQKPTLKNGKIIHKGHWFICPEAKKVGSNIKDWKFKENTNS